MDGCDICIYGDLCYTHIINRGACGGEEMYLHKTITAAFGLLCLLVITAPACAEDMPAPVPPPVQEEPQPPTPSPEPRPEPEAVPFAVTSPAFAEGGQIPVEYTCNGDDISPPLAWSGSPSATQVFVLVCDDPDAPAGTWTHWMVFDIPADTYELAQGASGALPAGAKHGLNSWKEAGYGGPCPPSGPAHHYRFTVYALDAPLGLTEGASRKEVEKAMEGRILSQTLLTGLFAR